MVAIGQMPGEGAMEKDEQGKPDEGKSTSTQAPPDTTTSTQPPPTTTTQAPIFTLSTTTITITASVSTTTVTSPPLIPKIAPVMTPTTERVTIHNIESDSDQEDQQPIIQLARRKVEKKKRKQSA
ncbi:uncharacterized protein LOC131875294 [Cryptomeria japonica]|uniref:uncharacterized protein LOC131875294 n=1 Tax=Cryptomeria japonica TaxID=3369 RepID=UPI0027DA9F46|nr:uncharacterized protein LOC131875294 [Cryptomeria japonica]